MRIQWNLRISKYFLTDPDQRIRTIILHYGSGSGWPMNYPDPTQTFLWSLKKIKIKILQIRFLTFF
jgi:hypothetical protein